MKYVYLIAAIFAAIIEHRSMEALSSARLFATEYATYRHASIAPTLLGAALMLIVLAVVAYRDRGANARSRDWLCSLAERAAKISLGRAFRSVLGLQLATLFSMESIEQLTSLGHLESGASFLGGPIVFGLVVASLVAIGVCVALRSALAAIVATIDALVRVCAECGFFFVPPSKRLVLATRAVRIHGHRVSILANRSGLRAPPQTL